MLPTTRPLMTSWSRYWDVMPASSQFFHDEGRLDVRRLAVLVLDDGVDRDRGLARVHPLDDVPVPVPDEGAADFPRPGQLVVVRVELLVQEHEPVDPGRRRKRLVDLRDLPGDQLDHLRFGGEIR